MLVALNDAGIRTVARDAIRGPQFRCPGCRGPVTLKHGSRVVPHYAHRPGSLCNLRGESPAHLALKDALWQAFRAQPWVASAELEVPVGDEARGQWRVDVLVTTAAGDRLALEAQVSARDGDDIKAKVEAYKALGLFPLYVTPSKALGIAEPTAAALQARHATEVSAPEWVRAIEWHGPRDPWSEYAVVAVWADDLFFVELDEVVRYSEWQDREAVRPLTRIRRLRVLGEAIDLSEPFHRFRPDSGFLLPPKLPRRAALAGMRRGFNNPRADWIRLADVSEPAPMLWTEVPDEEAARSDPWYGLALEAQAGGEPDPRRAAQLAEFARHQVVDYAKRRTAEYEGITAEALVRYQLRELGLEVRSRHAERVWQRACERADEEAEAARAAAREAKQKAEREASWVAQRRYWVRKDATRRGEPVQEDEATNTSLDLGLGFDSECGRPRVDD